MTRCVAEAGPPSAVATATNISTAPARKTRVWNVLTQADARMPPLVRSITTTSATISAPTQDGTNPSVTTSRVTPAPISPVIK